MTREVGWRRTLPTRVTSPSYDRRRRMRGAVVGAIRYWLVNSLQYKSLMPSLLRYSLEDSATHAVWHNSQSSTPDGFRLCALYIAIQRAKTTWHRN